MILIFITLTNFIYIVRARGLLVMRKLARICFSFRCNLAFNLSLRGLFILSTTS
jgi:hypothetical protein